MAWNRSKDGARQRRAERSSRRIGRLGYIVITAVALTGGVAFVMSSLKEDQSSVDGSDSATSRVRKTMRTGIPSNGAKQRKRPSKPLIGMFDHLSGEDRQRAEALQAALDDCDFKATLAAAKRALSSTNAEVRVSAVEALGWFGEEALPELTACMADADANVRQAAGNCWELAVQNLEVPETRLKISLAALGALSDEETLSMVSTMVAGAANEVIDGEETAEDAAKTRLGVVQRLVDIIDGEQGGNSIESAKEIFRDISGHEWRGIEEAERYLNDPDNYEEPEDSAEADS